jgi:hypothetical protein
MCASDRSVRTPIAAAVLLAGPLLVVTIGTPSTFCGQAAAVQAGQTRPAGSGQPAPEAAAARRLRSLFGTLTITLLLLVAFVVGASVMIRAGRTAVQRPRRRKPTQYVDAWAGYRLSQEEIARATGQAPDSDSGPDAGSDDDGGADSDPNSNEQG